MQSGINNLLVMMSATARDNRIGSDFNIDAFLKYLYEWTLIITKFPRKIAIPSIKYTTDSPWTTETLQCWQDFKVMLRQSVLASPEQNWFSGHSLWDEWLCETELIIVNVAIFLTYPI